MRVSANGPVALVEIDRPPHNHVNVALIRSLAEAFEDVDRDKSLRVSVLASSGKNFCAGADLVTPGNIAAGEGGGFGALYEQAKRLFAIRKPMVVAIQGAAVGAGLGLALVADFRIAAPDARFSANFVKLGLHPGFGITHTLPRVVGEQRAALICLTGRRFKAEEALRWGLVDEIAATDQLRARAAQLAAEIAENAPLAVQSVRATLRDGLTDRVQAQFIRELAEQSWQKETADYAEGVSAVAERRAGRFIGS